MEKYLNKNKHFILITFLFIMILCCYAYNLKKNNVKIHKGSSSESISINKENCIKKEKNENDVKILKILINEQIKKGACVNVDISNAYQYTWDKKTGRLIGINWEQKKLAGEINFNKLSKLRIINCSKNNITNICVSKLSELKELDCSNNKIKTLNLKGVNKLSILECSYNELKSINIDNLDNLIQFNCSNNKLKRLDVSKTEILEFGMDCSNNSLTELKLGDVCLRYLDCSNNALTYLDVSGLYEATELYCENNKLEYLKLISPSGSAYYLNVINCKNNKLSSLTIRGLSNIETLKCDKNVIIKQ